ncbi:MAG TPA: ATP-binding protein [Terracidiphilus sp.]|nr:ATP-binding protein [Terracidiphilus sp.]
MRWWPRSIRLQMLTGLVLVEALSIVLFAALLIRDQTHKVHVRAEHRLAHQATSVALQTKEALQQDRPDWVGFSVKMMGDAPSVAVVKVTDPAGNILYISDGEPQQARLDPAERAQIPRVTRAEPRVFRFDDDRWEGVAPILIGGELRGYAWVETDRAWDHEQLDSILSATVIFGCIWIAASALLVLLMAHSITRPLDTLLRGTRSLLSSPEGPGQFPLPVPAHNEIGDLIEAFNRTVAALEEQRSGLNDTLSLLDSMLANAPIGLAFLDRNCRFVRVNQVFAAMTGVPMASLLGSTLPEVLPQSVAHQLEDTITHVFADKEASPDLELTVRQNSSQRAWTWLASAYPVRTGPDEVRWAGVIVLDASERKRSEETLRKTEKLAATGRLAASIAHEINNPLEAITNLLFLMRNFCALEEPALGYVAMAEHEARRISEITQQTLRFYRQSTLPARANMGELIDSVLALYHGKLNTLGIQVERDYDAAMDLFCFAGEVRQVLANLVANAIDAMPEGGRLLVRARRSHNWKNPAQAGVRFAIADTGCGMDAAVHSRIFEPFFTTKEVIGTGLGLWVSHEIIAKSHGLVRVRSRTASEGHASGTVFEIFLPDDPRLFAIAARPAEAAGRVAEENLS